MSKWLLVALMVLAVVFSGCVQEPLESARYCSSDSDCVGFIDYSSANPPECVNKNFPKLIECDACEVVEDVKCKCSVSGCEKE